VKTGSAVNIRTRMLHFYIEKQFVGMEMNIARVFTRRRKRIETSSAH